MEIKTHQFNNITIAEIISDEIVLSSVDEALDLIGNLGYQGFDKIILHEKNIHPAFFDLKTKRAGDILQKFTQYQMAVAIIGDFSKFSSKSLNDFIVESNKSPHINFVNTLSAAIEK